MLSSLKTYLPNQARKPTGWFGRTVATRVFDRENKQMQHFALQLMGPNENDRILEIGFGNGYFISWLMPRIESGEVCGIDFSEDMVNKASERNRKWIDQDQLELSQAPIEEIPYPEDYFDKVFTANTIYFWPHPNDNLREVKRVLRAGDQFYCGMRTREQMEAKNSIVRENKEVFQNLYRRDEVAALFEEVGFEALDLHSQSTKDEIYYVVVGNA